MKKKSIHKGRKHYIGTPKQSYIGPEELDRLKKGYGGYNWNSEIREIYRKARSG